jgi:hypothetical protein
MEESDRKYYPGIFPGHKNLSQPKQPPRRYSKLESSDYEVEVLTTTPRCSVESIHMMNSKGI